MELSGYSEYVLFWTKLIGAFASMGLVGYVAKYCKRTYRNYRYENELKRNNMKILNDNIEHIRQLGPTAQMIGEMYMQFKNNGGSSVMDKLDQINGTLTQIDQESRILIWDSLPQGVFRTDKLGKFTKVNRTLLEMLGRGKYEVIGRGWISYIAPEDRDRVRKEYESSLSEQREFILDFNVLDARNGRIKVSVTARPTLQADQFIGYFGTFTRI